jgi:glycosyltransferase involved in cell wall biosynthesis
MKIAIDVHSLGTQAGGNETYFQQLLSGLAADSSDHQYTLFYTHPEAMAAVDGDPRFAFMSIPKNPVRRTCISLPRRLKEVRPDVFHCQYVQPPFGRTKTVVTIHDLAHEHFPEYFHPLEALRLKKLVRWTARRAAHIVTVSEFSAADIARKYDVPRGRITVAYEAASRSFRPREKYSCQEYLSRKYGIGFPFILYVGRIQARKNLRRLVEAYASLRKQGVAAKLVLVGKKDWQCEQLVAKIEELKLQSSVIFPGYVPIEDLPLFYNAAELFVFPSLFEGFGLPVVESMASGVPTITSLGSSLEEVAGDGAMLIDPQDTVSIAAAIGQVLADRELQSQLIARGLRRSAQFRQENLAQRVLQVYSSLR